MQIIYEHFTFPPDQSFTIRSEMLAIKKYASLRSHENFEIAFIENCSGKRFIGDRIQEFEGPELVLLGSYLPHCWQIDKATDPKVQPQATVIHFFPDFLGQQLLERPEAKPLNELFAKASKGIFFSGDTVTRAKQLMKEMLYETGLKRASLMLQLLEELAQSDTSQILSSSSFKNIEYSSEAQRLNKVFDYIFNNFKEEISLQEVAGILPMAPAAFCRFFKARTNRTLIDFVKEVRIGHAAKLLMEGKHNVTEACYHSGYNNISNFNKYFKEINGLTPRAFKKQFTGSKQESLLQNIGY
ncbi:AraC family transcriptional regulator [Chitinophagaceae bacterium LB-8]|uniref:AraC family transcriptional regulator n=1 Tax=Paraflavisolibacter caeni TaxID=2982496 RepID=A0A9X3BFY8_9BACT|nr:AraC family transcriptional regulator [Paraflavisolibacter caeni]MCU7549909.1 AraC family transcriptional regulator [Paraflavisolibacter caeni]